MSRTFFAGISMFAVLLAAGLVVDSKEAQARRGCGGAVVNSCDPAPSCGGRVGLFAKLHAAKAASCCAPAAPVCEPAPVCCEPAPSCGGRVGLFAKLKAACAARKASCCEPAPTCCEPAPVCCEPAPAPVCCEPAPVCCEPAPAPSCCEAAPSCGGCGTSYTSAPVMMSAPCAGCSSTVIDAAPVMEESAAPVVAAPST